MHLRVEYLRILELVSVGDEAVPEDLTFLLQDGGNGDCDVEEGNAHIVWGAAVFPIRTFVDKEVGWRRPVFVGEAELQRIVEDVAGVNKVEYT